MQPLQPLAQVDPKLRKQPRIYCSDFSRFIFSCVFIWLCLVTTGSHLFAQEVENTTAPPAITADQIRPHIEYLADKERQGRRGKGKHQAADYIISQFQGMGLYPLFSGRWTQEVPARVSDESSGSGEAAQVGYNLGGFIPGTDPELKKEWIIVNAHYDHLGIQWGEVFPGADDNASGVSMLIEVARKLKVAPLKRSVAFVAFDFEESFLWGSRWFMGHTPMETDQIKFCVTADMIGRSLGGLTLPTVFVIGAEHSQVARDALSNAVVPVELEIAQLGADMIGTRSDYGPFRDQQIPFLFFSTGEHPDYHTPGDTADKIEYDKAARICTLIRDLLIEIGNTKTTLAWEQPVYQKLEEAKAVHRVTQQLLDAEAEGTVALSSMQRFFVSQVKAKSGYMVRVGRVSDDERKWVSRTAQMLLIAVF
ncbi:MAG TPA: M28 family peptidase [Planctomicrobium sp.]|nr:M28 family peptidase [Planctomicrobium sp.]